MPSLVIHAPSWAATSLKKRSFDTILKTKVGEGYAIFGHLKARISKGCKVIILDKNAERRAEGVLVELDPTTMTKSGIQRYDVKMKDIVESQKYTPEKLNRCGVALIP